MGVDPGHLGDLGLRPRLAVQVNPVEPRAHHMAGFVGRRCSEVAEFFGCRSIKPDPEFFANLPGQRVERLLPRFDLPAGLHERRGAALADNQ